MNLKDESFLNLALTYLRLSNSDNKEILKETEFPLSLLDLKYTFEYICQENKSICLKAIIELRLYYEKMAKKNEDKVDKASDYANDYVYLVELIEQLNNF